MELFNVSHTFLAVPPIHEDGTINRELSSESIFQKLLHITDVCKKRELFDSFSFKKYSHFFITKSRLLKVVKQAFFRLTFAMNQ